MNRENQKNQGNFKELIKLISKFNPSLQNFLSRSKNACYTSPSIQNELLSLSANEIKKQITNSVNSAQFFAIIVDGTTDVSHTEQFSFCVRYVDMKFKINERFENQNNLLF